MVPVTSVVVMFSNTRPDPRRKGLSASGDRSGMGSFWVGSATTTDATIMAGLWSGVRGAGLAFASVTGFLVAGGGRGMRPAHHSWTLTVTCRASVGGITLLSPGLITG